MLYHSQVWLILKLYSLCNSSVDIGNYNFVVPLPLIQMTLTPSGTLVRCSYTEFHLIDTISQI